jgi:hypothetical protein
MLCESSAFGSGGGLVAFGGSGAFGGFVHRAHPPGSPERGTRKAVMP